MLEPPAVEGDMASSQDQVVNKVVFDLSATVSQDESLQKQIKDDRKAKKQAHLLSHKLYHKCTNHTLQCELKSRGLTTSGNKKKLAARLRADDQSQSNDVVAES